jgi:micrococcal nuclease
MIKPRLPFLILVNSVIALTQVRGQTASVVEMHVWINTRSKVYHCPGTPAFRNTTKGELVPERTAIARGYRANGRRECTLTLPDSLYPISLSVAALAKAPNSPRRKTVSCLLLSVTDGDTILCQDSTKIRLIGIDAPERDQEPFGVNAAAALMLLAPLGSRLDLEQDVTPRDRYGRMLAYVWLNGSMINWTLVRQGWAVAYAYRPDTSYAQVLAQAERDAKAEERGLWKIGGFGCHPISRRKRRC